MSREARTERLLGDIERSAEAVRRLFNPSAGAVVTVIVRTPGIVGDGDVVVTAEDDLELALSAARRRMRGGS